MRCKCSCRFLLIFLAVFCIMLINIKSVKAEGLEWTESTTWNSGNGCVIIDMHKELSLQYDDRYSLTELCAGYEIIQIQNVQVTSYQVAIGAKTDQLDSDVVVRQKDSDMGIVATGVGKANILLVPENWSDYATQILNHTYTGGTRNIPAMWITVTVAPAELTTMFLAGQSNMEGSCSTEEGYHPENSVLCGEGNVYSTYAPSTEARGKKITGMEDMAACTGNNAKYFVAESLTSSRNLVGTKIFYPLNSLSENGNGKTGPDSGLAYEWNKRTGEKVWIINAAWGGSSVTSWKQNGEAYKRAVEVFSNVIQVLEAEVEAGHYVESHRLMFWLQGEADRKESFSCEKYLKYFLSMYSGMKSVCNYDYMGIISVRGCKDSSYMDFRDLYMTSPRIVQYCLAGNKEYPDLFMSSNINELWVSDSSVDKYFSTKYTSGKVDYPLRAQSTITELPDEVKDVHSDIHYSQIGHNENGITAADGIYEAIYGSMDGEIPIKWTDKNGLELREMECTVGENQILIPIVSPSYYAKDISYVSDSVSIQWDRDTGILSAISEGSGNIRAVDVNGNVVSEFKITVDALQKVEIRADNVKSGIRLTWSSINGATKYKIYRGYTNLHFSKISEGKQCSYLDKNVDSAGIYLYRVKAYYPSVGKWSSYSDLVVIQFLETPEITLTNSGTGVKISWNSCPQAEGYSIYKKISGGSYSKIGSTSKCSYTDTDVVSGKKYYYMVKAYHGSILSGGSEKSIVFLSAPTLQSISGVNTGINITWKAVAGAVKYRVFRKNSAGKWVGLANVTETSYTDTTAKTGNTYVYTVRCIDSTCKVFTSSYDSTGIALKYLSTPSLENIQGNNKGVVITWKAVTGAVKYGVYRKNSSGKWVRLAIVTGTSYTDTDVKTGSTYVYTVRCINSAGNICHSGFNTKGITIKYLSTPALKSVQVNNNGIILNWGAVPGASKYKIFRKNESGNWTGIAVVSGTSYTDTHVEKGHTYVYTVRCVGNDSNSYLSGYQTEGLTVQYLQTPVLKSIKNETGGVTVSWGKVKGAVQYRVYRKSGNSGWTLLATVSETNYTDKSVVKGKTYTYTVRCVNGGNKVLSSGYDAKGISIFYK